VELVVAICQILTIVFLFVIIIFSRCFLHL